MTSAALPRRLPLAAVTRWGSRLATYRGKSRITMLLPQLAADDAGLVSFACDARSAYMQFWRSVFERRAPRLHRGSRNRTGRRARAGELDSQFPEPLLHATSQACREARPGGGKLNG
jgi:hypothetical protein